MTTTFLYKGWDRAGRIIKGSIRAETAADAQQMVSERGIRQIGPVSVAGATFRIKNWFVGKPAQRIPFFRSLAALLDAGLSAAYQQLTHVFGYDPAWLDAHEADLRKAVAAACVALAPFEVAAARVRMLLDFDRSADLRQIARPTLIIGARDDALIPIHHARRLAALIPHAAFTELQGAHFHPRTDPGPFADRVAAFLDEQGG